MDFSVLVHWSHIISLVIWMGGLFFMLVALLPVTVAEEGVPEPVFIGVALRFRAIIWGCMAVFALTTLWGVEAQSDMPEWDPILKLKIGLGGMMILLGLANTLVYLPKIHQGLADLDSNLNSDPTQPLLKERVRADYQGFVISGALMVVLGAAVFMVLALGGLI